MNNICSGLTVEPKRVPLTSLNGGDTIRKIVQFTIRRVQGDRLAFTLDGLRGLFASGGFNVVLRGKQHRKHH